ncbi:MAG TPA: hypothetical protein VH762_10870 [Gemmatimonadaceae bacterium]
MRSLGDFARRLSSATGLTAGLLLLGNTAAAQDASLDSRWQTWIGCWEAVDPQSAAATETSRKPRVCVIPAAGKSAVDVATVVGDSVALRQHIDATGEQRETLKDGCKGWERATWSANGSRVFLRSAYTCPGGLTRTSNGVMAMTSDGDWLDVLGVVAGTTVGVRAARYREVIPATLPAEIAAALKDRSQWAHDARIAAAAQVTTADVIEASRYIDPGVIQTWLAERGDGFGVDAKQLVDLEKAGVPPLVIDVMVALSYPEVFSLDRTRIGGAPADSLRDDVGVGRTVYIYGWDPFYSPYGYRGGYYGGYGYGGYGYGGWYNGSRPIVVVRQPAGEKAHGHVDKDKGYTPGSGATPRRGSTSGTRDQARGSKGESGGSSTKGSSGSGGSSSKGTSSGSGRTAKPRPPGA